MKSNGSPFRVCLVLAATQVTLAPAEGATVDVRVQVDRPGARINPAMWGVFFEDINGGADGGLYADLAGAPGGSPRGAALVLTSPSLADENSLAEPRRVAPKEEALGAAAARFRRLCPAHSFTVLRLAHRS